MTGGKLRLRDEKQGQAAGGQDGGLSLGAKLSGLGGFAEGEQGRGSPENGEDSVNDSGEAGERRLQEPDWGMLQQKEDKD